MSQRFESQCPGIRRGGARGPRRLALAGFVVPLLLGTGAGDAGAKILQGIRMPAEYRTWTIETADGKEETVSQLYVPVITTWELGNGRSLVLSAEGAAGGPAPHR
jgi:hypothetical protein